MRNYQRKTTKGSFPEEAMREAVALVESGLSLRKAAEQNKVSFQTLARVSSVLNRDTHQFGKKHLIDGKDDTCWNSNQGSPQWLILNFGSMFQIYEVHIQFQGGFAGKECWVEGSSSQSNFSKMADIFPEDINSRQIFKMPEDTSPIDCMKIVFNSSTDLYGRVTIYSLDVIGSPT